MPQGPTVQVSDLQTLSRLLVLSVCLGYGVVRPTLGNVAYCVDKILSMLVVVLQ